MSVVLVAAPTAEPVTLNDLKIQIGLSPIEDTDHVKADMQRQLLRRYITTARVECENRTRRAFLTQTWRLSLDSLHHSHAGFTHRLPSFYLPKPPFQSVVSFTYLDQTGTAQAYPAAAGPGPVASDPAYTYQLDPGSETQPARISPGYMQPWPFVLYGAPNAINLTFVCGYGNTGAAVPASITQAILFLAHSYFDPGAFKNVDALVDSLLNPYVNRIA